MISYKRLNEILKAHDLGDDFFDYKNIMFDEDYSCIKRKDLVDAMTWVNSELAWYFEKLQESYNLSDCNKYHAMAVGRLAEYFTKLGYKNTAIGRAFGKWYNEETGKMDKHCWAWAVLEGEKLVWINWQDIIDEHTINGNGAIAA